MNDSIIITFFYVLEHLFAEELGEGYNGISKEQLLAMIDEKQQLKDSLFASKDPREVSCIISLSIFIVCSK